MRTLGTLMATFALAACASGPAVSTRGLVRIRTPHLDAWAVPGSFAAGRLPELARERQRALVEIAELLELPPPTGVVLVFYPDEETKFLATGHRGLGRGEGRTVVEVHNESIRLDPVHELVHVVAGELGHPPALFDEGLAVYLAERFGADALALLGRPGQSIRAAGCELLQGGQALALERLIDFAELGAPETQGPVSYPQSDSVTEYLVAAHGLDRFREAFRKLRRPDTEEKRLENRRRLPEIYRASLSEIELGWRRWVCRAAASRDHLERSAHP